MARVSNPPTRVVVRASSAGPRRIRNITHGLDIRVSQYIRAHWPGKTVAVSGWGMRFDDLKSLPALVELSRNIDYLIDVRDSTREHDAPWRKTLIRELSCSFGTLGGPQGKPP